MTSKRGTLNPFDPAPVAVPADESTAALFSAVTSAIAAGWTVDRIELDDSVPSVVLSQPVGGDPDTPHVALCMATLGLWFLPWMAWRVFRPSARDVQVMTMTIERGEVISREGLTPSA